MRVTDILIEPETKRQRRIRVGYQREKKQKKISDTVECSDGYNEYTRKQI